MATKTKKAARAVRARNMTFCTLASGGLGVRTARGILDVARASALFRIKAPADIHAVIDGADCAPLAGSAATSANLPLYSICAASRSDFMPCCTVWRLRSLVRND